MKPNASFDALFDGSDAHLLPDEPLRAWLDSHVDGALAGDAMTVAQRVWDAATAAEREACAKVCESHDCHPESISARVFACCAEAIRNRK